MLENEITKEEAELRAKNIFEYDELFILLSFRNANMNTGLSVPYIAKLNDSITGIIAFSKEEYAKNYIESHKFEILDGVYPIGKIEKTNKYNNISSVLNIANALGISFLDFNVGADDNTIGAYISWILDVCEKHDEIAILTTKEQANKIINEDEKVELRFNPISFINYNNPYEVNEDGAETLLRSVFAFSSVEDFYEHFLESQTIFENCYVCDYIHSSMIPHANQLKKQDDVKYFESVSSILEKVIKNKIFNLDKIFTLVDSESGNVINRNGIIYLLYTDRYKYMGQFEYRLIENKSELLKLIEESQAKKAVVTDGTHGMAVVDLGGINDSGH